MIKKFIKKVNRLQDWIDAGIQKMEERTSPKRKVFILLSLFVIFGSVSIYMTISSVYNLGKNRGRQIEIEHIHRLELEQRSTKDSITNKNNMHYEYGKRWQ